MRAGRDWLLFSFVPANITTCTSECVYVCIRECFLVCAPITTGVSASVLVCVCVLELLVLSLSLFPDGQSACMWPGESAAVLRNETPSARFFMAMSVCCDANEPSLPKTPPLIVVFDLPLILLIRSPTFKVKRFACTSKSAPACLCVCVHKGKLSKIA